MEIKKTQITNEATFSEVKPSQVNGSFDEAVVRIACTGNNANGSHFTLEAFEKALPSLKNIPIVGLYKEDTEDFGGHETSYEIQDGEFRVVYNTFPFGVIHESAKQWYEQVEEKGELKTYLVSECLLWKRQKSYNLIKENGAYSVSMEIEVKDGVFNSDSIYEVRDFIFTAVCVLGTNVEPCFKSAEIKLFSENVEYANMLQAYKQFAIDVFKGGENVKDEVLEVVEEVVTEEVAIEETIEEVVEEIIEEVVEATEEVVEGATEEVEETPIEVVEETIAEVVEYNEVVVEDIVEEVTEEVVEDVIVDNEIVVEEAMENNDIEVEEVAEPTMEIEVEEIVEDFEAKYNELQVEYGKLANELHEIKVEFERLQQFEQNVLAEQRIAQEMDLFDKFSMLNGVEEFEALKGDCSQYTLEQIETMCYAMVGRQSFAMKQKTKAPTQTSVKLNFSSKQDTRPVAYGGILG